jgi:adenine phosphoribosyltransferase
MFSYLMARVGGDMNNYLRLIDVHTTGPRYDVTPLFSDYEAFTALVEELARPFADAACDYVAGIDALGFILGTAVALRLQKGFLPIRKGGKLPAAVHRVAFVDYSGETKSLEVRHDALPPGQKVLLVDEWVETGAQMQAAVQLIERLGCAVIGVAAINIDDNAATGWLREAYRCHTVWLDDE